MTAFLFEVRTRELWKLNLPAGGQAGRLNQKILVVFTLFFTHLPLRFLAQVVFFFLIVRPFVTAFTSAIEMLMPAIGPVGRTSL
jgi:hypothetical protein